MRSLIIDSSTASLSLALMADNKLISEMTTNTKIQHSTQLMPLIQTMFETVKWLPDTIERIIVTRGPGSYTGLRIGTTAAKTLAYTLNAPLYSVSSLQAIAVNAESTFKYVFPFINARRGTVFATEYEHTSTNGWSEIGETAHYQFSDWLEHIAKLKLTGPLYFISPDYDLFAEEIIEKFGQQAIIANEANSLIKASRLILAPLVEVDVDTFVPEYAKLAEAEEKWREKNQDKLAHEASYIERTD